MFHRVAALLLLPTAWLLLAFGVAGNYALGLVRSSSIEAWIPAGLSMLFLVVGFVGILKAVKPAPWLAAITALAGIAVYIPIGMWVWLAVACVVGKDCL